MYYKLLPSYWGIGYATENISSIKVLEKPEMLKEDLMEMVKERAASGKKLFWTPTIEGNEYNRDYAVQL